MDDIKTATIFDLYAKCDEVEDDMREQQAGISLPILSCTWNNYKEYIRQPTG